ncbi:MAG: class I SAM-dependent methyltransferase [Prevotella sp.]|nr:class I SAM-dependent methyltransferase [Prevotella sp.]
MGTLSKFWNTNARPEGWMGRLALRMMNLTHTPMALWNLSLIDFQPDWTVLDIGCGGGKNIARMLKRCPEGKVYGVDYSEESVAYSIKNNRRHIGTRCFIQQGNVMELPYEDAKFDLVTAYETVYFWPDLPKAFAEVFRVLKPGGMFTFSYGDESSSTMRYWADEIEAMRILPTSKISQLLTEAGFTDLQIARKGGYTINFRVKKKL